MAVCKNKVVRDMIASGGDPAVINKLTQKSLTAKLGAGLFETYVNGILSGPTTHAINIGSNALTLAWAPTESFTKALMSSARLDFQDAQRNFIETGAKLSGILGGLSDATRLIYKQTQYTGNSVKSRFNGTHDDFVRNNERPGLKDLGIPQQMLRSHEVTQGRIKPAITSEEFGLSSDMSVPGMLGYAMDVTGKLIRIPGAALMKEDKFFKLLHYRTEINAESVRRAHADPGASSENKRAAYRTFRDNPSDDMIDQAVDMSEYYTFTNQLGQVGSDVQRSISQTPAKVFIPFFKTPTNIVKMGIRHSVFGNVYEDLQPALKHWNSGTAEQRAAGDAARARISLGTLVPAAIIYNLGENITGRIDQSTPEGRFKAQQGRPPYSIEMPNGAWWSYEKFEPLRSILGLYVNYRDAVNAMNPTDPDTGQPNPLYEQAYMAAVTPMIQTIGDNYMLEATGGILDLLTSNDSATAEAQAMKITASLVPYSNFMRQTNRVTGDNVYRMADTLLEKIQQFTPGQSNKLPPSLTLWGDTQIYPNHVGPDIISPIKTATKELDIYDDEIIRLDVNIPSTPRSFVWEGIKLDLNTQQRHDFAKIRGKGVPGVDMPTLKDVIVEMMDTQGFQSLSDIDRKTAIEARFAQATKNTKEFMFGTYDELQLQFDEKIELFELERQRTQR